MALGTIAAIVGIVGAASSLGATAYSLSGAGQPQYPNEEASSAQMAQTNAALLPIQRGMAAAAQTGGSYTFNLPAGTSAASLGIQPTGGGWYDQDGNLVSNDQNYMVMQSAPGAKIPSYTAVSPQSAGLTWRPASQTINGVPITQNNDGSYTINFNGFSTAQAAATEAQQSAASQLALEQQYDPQFISQALQEEQQADPESFAARNEMNNLVQQQANAPLNEPVSTMLNSQIQDALNAAQNNSLTAVDTARLNAAVADALGARGGSVSTLQGVPGSFEQPLTTGFAGEQRQFQAAQSALGFLGSGSDPEDIEYRRTQQNLANLAAEANGQTPSSQFASLSSASSGPAPMSQGATLPLMTDNGAAAQQIGLQNWQTQMQNANNQINPWLAGTSSLLQLGSAITPRTPAMPTLLTPQNPAS
ncbi:MAG TPA: hypothetical protein VMF08_13580 [Candidatus Sulfotelmatobacter sp.]|nr:hypothetical protein [Candidatus Sulfotelmatobacter sp.]